MTLYKQFRTDEGLERTGILLEYGMTTDGKPICIKIARAGGSNKAYERMLEAEVKPYRRLIQNETIEAAVVNRIMRRVYARTVVIGWENVQGEDGKDIPFSPEACEKLFEDLPELFADIQVSAQKSALFRAEIREEDAKN